MIATSTYESGSPAVDSMVVEHSESRNGPNSTTQ